jgi:predicted transcriptional regulator
MISKSYSPTTSRFLHVKTLISLYSSPPVRLEPNHQSITYGVFQMRNVSHYVQKLNESTSLNDIERYVKGARNQIKSDIESIQKKRNQLMDSVKKLDQELVEIPTIEKEIVKIAGQKFAEIMALPVKPKRQYKKKLTVKKDTIKKEPAIEINRQPARKRMK